MDVSKFTQHVLSEHRRIAELRQRSTTATYHDQPLLAEALAELDTTMEELRTVDEYLRAQQGELLQAQETIDDERRHYYDLFQLAPVAYLVTDTAGVIQEANRAATRMLDVLQPFLVGKPLVVWMPPEGVTHWYEVLAQARQATQPLTWYVQLQLPHRAPMAVQLQGNTIRNPDGDVTGLRWTLIPVDTVAQTPAATDQIVGSSKHALRTDEERLRFQAEASAILASSLDYETTLQEIAQLAVPRFADWCFVHLLDEDDRLRWLAGTHVKPELVALAHKIAERYPFDPDAPHGMARALRTGQPELLVHYTDDVRTEMAQDREHLALLQQLNFSSSITVPLLARERMFGAIEFITDGSGRIYNAVDLDLAQDLAHRAAMAIDHARLYKQAQEAVQARDAYLALAAHELNTPITSLLGFAYALQHRPAPDQPLNDREQQLLVTIRRQCERLRDLIDSLMDVSRLEAGQFELECRPLDLRTLAQQIVADLAPTLQRHTIDLHATHEPLLIEGDGLRLEQVLNNLLQNAIKYSPQGGPVTLRVDQEHDHARITVIDQGIGIPAEEIAHLFEPFYRVQTAATQHIRGFGIGLYVTCGIVSAHGGTIEVASKEGHGSTFTIRVPLAGAAQERGASPSEW